MLPSKIALASPGWLLGRLQQCASLRASRPLSCQPDQPGAPATDHTQHPLCFNAPLPFNLTEPVTRVLLSDLRSCERVESASCPEIGSEKWQILISGTSATG